MTTAHPSRIATSNGAMIVETRWSDVTVTDYLDCSDRRPFEPAGQHQPDPGHPRHRPNPHRVRPQARLRPRPHRAARHQRRPRGVGGRRDHAAALARCALGHRGSDGPHQTAVADVELDGTPLELVLRLGIHGRPYRSEVSRG